MISFLFWNVKHKPIEGLISELAESHSIDIIILAESNIEHSVMLKSLNAINSPKFYHAKGLSKKTEIYTKFLPEFVVALDENRRVSIRKFSLPARTEFNLVAVHMPSKNYFKEEDQHLEFILLASMIKEAEEQEKNFNTIIVGDFNLKPFENGAVSAMALNSVMTKDIAMKGTRIVQEKQYPYFYNPMWSKFGDLSNGPPGSYYYNNPGHISYFWNIMDQVLIRPNLIKRFKEEDLEIIDTIG